LITFKITPEGKQYPQKIVETQRDFVKTSSVLTILFMSTSISQEFAIFD
jgi:hypothetical protein